MSPCMLRVKIQKLCFSACILLSLILMSACGDSLKEFFHPSDDDFVVSPLAETLGFSKERPLVMGMNTSYAPLQYVDGRGTPSGYDVEFTKKLLERMGIPYTFSPNHWDKMSPGIIEGKYDMGLLVYSPYRKELTNYSQAVFRMYYQIVYRKKDYSTFDFRHLKDKEIAYMKSRPIGLMLKEEHAKDVPITDLSKAFRDLADGKYDGVICYRFQAQYNIDLLNLRGQLQTEELSLEPREYCYASHDPRLIKAINEELIRMEREGVIDEVYGDNVLTQFGAIKIPRWVWVLLILLVFLFLLIFSINRYRFSKRLQKAYDALLVANERANESTRMKSQFIKQISHEIRTPLNILSGFTQLITSSGIQLSEADQDEARTEIVKSTDRITGLVNKMLELSDISSQTVLERKDLVNALQVAQQAAKNTSITDVAHVEFTLKQEEGADVTFATDKRAAVRILELLLDNAIKFTCPTKVALSEGGCVKQQVTLVVGSDADTVQFAVEDTGIGIPADEAEHIFDEFVQLDEYYNGTGIGLTVARSLARRLGGDVKLDTTCTDRTRFVITLLA